MQDAGRISQLKAELQTLQTATESYYTNNNHIFPANTDGGTVMNTLTSQTPQILNTYLYDPFNGSSAYGYYTTGNYYVWYSQGGASSLTADTVSTAGVVTSNSGEYCVSNGAGC